MRGTKHSKREEPKHVTISINNDNTRRAVKSNFRLANYEKLLY